MERVSSGVPGLDELVEGGFPKGSTVLISGAPGTGKTIMAMQFLMEGIRNGEKVLYLSLEEIEESLKEQAKQFGWDLDELCDQNKLQLLKMNPRRFKDEFSSLRFVKENISRMAVDSISPIMDVEESPRDVLHAVLSGMKGTGITSLFVSELGPEGGLSRDGVSEYVCDGVIKLSTREIGGEVERIGQVKKMRATKIDPNKHSIEISDNGIEFLPK